MAKKQDTKLTELKKEIESLNEQLMRERADAANVRRRAESEKLQMASYYKANVVKELLPIIDNFERSLKNVPKELDKSDYVKGVKGVVKQFETTLEKLGVQRIATVGEEFNPDLHEAVSHEDGDGERQEVVEELQSGYTLQDELLRPAMVRVKG